MRNRLLGGLCLSLVMLALSGSLWNKRWTDRLDAPDSTALWRSPESSLTADFDGDQQPDLAVCGGSGGGYSVQIRFTSNTPGVLLTFPVGGPGIRIQARDVDQDDDQDIVVSTAVSDIPIAVWLGDGKGHFQPGDPWACLPKHLNGPQQYNPSLPLESSPSLTEDTLQITGLPPKAPAVAELNAGALIPSSSVSPTREHFRYSLIARGPPAAGTSI